MWQIKSTRVATGPPGRDYLAVLVFTLIVLLQATQAMAQLRTIVAGEPFGMRPVPRDSSARHQGMRLWAADRELFGIAGLRISGAGADWRFTRGSIMTSLAEVASSVGSERLLVVGAEVSTGTFRLGSAFDIERLELAGLSARSRYSVSVSSEWRVVDGFYTASRLDGFRVGGEALRGIDMTISAGTRSQNGRLLTAGMLLGRRGDTGFFTRTEFPLDRRLRLGFAYDALSDQLGGSVSVNVGALLVTAQVFLHRVLGRSHGVVLSWSA